MNAIPTHRHLLGRADSILRKAVDAERGGNPREIEDVRRDGQRTMAALAEAAKEQTALDLIKAALNNPLTLGGDTASQTGAAMADGSYAIHTAADVASALALWRNNGQSAAARKHILRRATELGALDKVPDDWRGDTAAGGDNPRKVAGSHFRKFGR